MRPLQGSAFSERDGVDCDQEEPQGSLGGEGSQTRAREKLLPGAPETSKWSRGRGAMEVRAEQPCNRITRLSVQHKDTCLETPGTPSRPSAVNKRASDGGQACTPNTRDTVTEL